MAQISRDVFARRELHSVSVTPHDGETCTWCGNLSGNGKLYAYRLEYDGGSKERVPGRFCSVACMRSYHA